MYAVIKTGGKQYKVQPGDIIQVEKLDGEKGGQVNFNEVLFFSKKDGETAKIWLGKPTLSGASVAAEVVGQGRDSKVLIIKMKRRKQYRRTQGHRQWQTQLLVTAVDNGAGEKATLEASEKKAILAKFSTNLRQPGQAFSKKAAYAKMEEASAKRLGLLSIGTEAQAPAKTKKAAAPKKKAAAKK